MRIIRLDAQLVRPQRVVPAMEEHLKFLALLRARDEGGAVSAMQEHVERSRQRVLNATLKTAPFYKASISQFLSAEGLAVPAKAAKAVSGPARKGPLESADLSRRTPKADVRGITSGGDGPRRWANLAAGQALIAARCRHPSSASPSW